MHLKIIFILLALFFTSSSVFAQNSSEFNKHNKLSFNLIVTTQGDSGAQKGSVQILNLTAPGGIFSKNPIQIEFDTLFWQTLESQAGIALENPPNKITTYLESQIRARTPILVSLLVKIGECLSDAKIEEKKVLCTGDKANGVISILENILVLHKELGGKDLISKLFREIEKSDNDFSFTADAETALGKAFFKPLGYLGFSCNHGGFLRSSECIFDPSNF